MVFYKKLSFAPGDHFKKRTQEKILFYLFLPLSYLNFFKPDLFIKFKNFFKPDLFIKFKNKKN